MSGMEIDTSALLNEEDVVSCLQSVSLPLDVKLKAATTACQSEAQLSGRMAGVIFQFASNLLIRSADYFIKHDKVGRLSSDTGEDANAELAGNKSVPAFMNTTLWQILNKMLLQDITEISVGVTSISMHFLKPVSCLCLQFLATDSCSDFNLLSTSILQTLRTLRTKYCGIAGGGSWQPPMQNLAAITGKLILRYCEVSILQHQFVGRKKL